MVTRDRLRLARRHAAVGRRLCAPCAVAVAAAVLFMARPAQSSLGDQVRRLRSGWAAVGVQVGHVGTLFLHQGMQRAIGLPSGTEARCQTVVAVAERHVRFTLRRLEPAGGASHAEAPAEPAAAPAESDRGRLGAAPGGEVVASRAGVAKLSHCGTGPGQLQGVHIAMQSARGAVELLLARHDPPLPPVGLVVPERAAGPVAPHSMLRRPRVVEPLAARVARASAAAKLDRARTVVRVDHRASAAGSGVLGLKLSAGCHRVVVLAAGPQGGPSSADIDAEVRRPGAARALRQDRSFAPDARLEFCLGEPGPVQLRFLGAPALSAVAVATAHWPLPPAIAGLSGAERRAALAWALHRRPTPLPQPPALRQVRGAPGATVLPVEIEPGACYLAALGVEQGMVDAARLSVSIGDRYARDQSSEPPHGLAVTFCAGSAERASLQVEVRSAFSWWTLMLWQVHRGGS